VSYKTRMEDPVRHADYRFRSRVRASDYIASLVRAWRWRRALWGGRLTRKISSTSTLYYAVLDLLSVRVRYVRD